MAKVTIQDVAREAGVALGTVSNALNHPDKVRPDTLALVNAAIKKLGYAPNQNARLLAGGANAAFGLILPRLDHGISLQIANGANVEARKHGYDLFISNVGNDIELEGHYLQHYLGSQMAGILLQPIAPFGWEPPASLPVPAVYLDYHGKGSGYYVAPDNRAQGALIAEHAIAGGARHIAVFGRTEFARHGMRVMGVTSVMETNPDVEFEFLDEGAWDLARDGYEIGRRLAERPQGQRPDFIIAVTDVLAVGAINGVQAAGLSVPDDIAIAGCDGNPLAWSGSVPLTTIAPPGYEVGRKGVQYLIEQIELRKSDPDEAARQERENHMELVRPFLLTRTSSERTAIGPRPPETPDLNLGTYL